MTQPLKSDKQLPFVYYKLSEFVPELILSSQPNQDQFIQKSLEHIGEHHFDFYTS